MVSCKTAVSNGDTVVLYKAIAMSFIAQIVANDHQSKA